MPDWRQSTCPLSISQVQRDLGPIVADLKKLDERLQTLAKRLILEPNQVLPADLRSGVEGVCIDLLQDAIVTLADLAILTEDETVRRRFAIAAACEHIAAAERIAAINRTASLA